MTKKGHKQAKFDKEIVERKEEEKKDGDEEEINSGFGNYLKSSTGMLS